LPLDGERADAAGPCRDEDLLARLELEALLERLPRSEPDHWDRRRLHVVEIVRLQRCSTLRDHGKFGDGASALVEDVGEDRIADLEPGHAAADLDHDTGQIAAQGCGKLKLHDGLEDPGGDHVVDRVDAGRIDLDQQFVGLRCGAENVGEADPG
jgi:hypothetical protein